MMFRLRFGFSLVAALLLALSSTTTAFALSSHSITKVESCYGFPPSCEPGIVLGASFVAVRLSMSNTDSAPTSNTIQIDGVSIPATANKVTDAGMLYLDVFFYFDDVGTRLDQIGKKQSVQVVVQNTWGTHTTTAPVTCATGVALCSSQATPTPTPTPSVQSSITPSPTARASVTPSPSAQPSNSVPKIENDLKGECEKQNLEYDFASGLCLPQNPYKANANSLAGQVTLGGLIKRVLNILLTLAGVIAVLMIVLGGYQYVTSQGADDKAKAGRKTVTNAALGLIAVLLAYMLVTVVTNFITQGTIF